MANVIRQDVVQIGFESDALEEVKKLTKELDTLKKKFGVVDDDNFDETEDSAKKARKEIEKTTKSTGKLGDALKKVASVSFKAVAVGIGAAATAVGKITYEAVQAYGEFEQLEGGMKKIFDEADTAGIMRDANNAYIDLGMSANEYLSKINDTGANFAAIMGDQKGYETARLGLTAISDYATGTGKSIDELSEKYTMITRSSASYQSIADQFSGILPATSNDFLEQAKAAGFLSDKYKKLTDVPIAEYQEAVTKMLDKGVKGLGLAENTAEEAEKTFSGSLGMMKSAWGNLMIAIGSGEGLDQCFDNMLVAAEAFGDNLEPILERSLLGIGKLIEKLAPKIEDKLPQLAKDLLPPLIKAAVSLVKGLIKALPQIVKTLFETIVDIFAEQFPILKKVKTFFEKNSKGIVSALEAIVPAVIGIVGAFKLFKGIKGISSIFGKASGGSGGGLGGIFSGLKNTKWGDLLQTIGKISLVLVALGGLVYLAGLLAKEMRKQDMKAVEILELTGIITAVGVAGGAIAKIAGTIGKIPIAVVAKGMAGIAIVIGALEVIFLALGALNSIPGFSGIIEKGGELLAVTFGAIGKAIGSLIGGIVGGIASGASSALPDIGEGIKGFTTALAGADFNVLSEFFTALSGIKEVPKSGGIFQLFTGDPYAGLLKMCGILPLLGIAVKSFLANVGSSADFGALASFLTALSNIGGLPNAGGFFGLFTGDPYEGLKKMMEVLPEVATKAKETMGALGGITDFSPIGSLLTALSNVSLLPNAGGFWQSIAGDPFEGLKKMMEQLPLIAAPVKAFLASIGGVTDFSPITSLMTALSSVSLLPKAGGFWQSISGDAYEGMKTMMNQLPTLAIKVCEFFTNLGGITDFNPIVNLMTAISSVSQLKNAGGVAQFFAGDAYKALEKMSELLPGLALSVKSFYDSLGGLTDFNKITELFTVLGGLGDLVGRKGGIFGAIGELFAGSKENGLAQLGTALGTFATSASGFFGLVNEFNSQNLTALIDGIVKLGTETTTLRETIVSEFETIVTTLRQALMAALLVVTTTLGQIKVLVSTTNLATSGALMMQSLVIGINSKRASVLNAVGAITNGIKSKVRNAMNGLDSIGYARGTTGHRGGNAIVNDGRGAELVQMPSGRAFIPNGRNVFLPNAPKGMQVFDAESTAKLFGKTAPTFRYASGTSPNYTPSSMVRNTTTETNTYAPTFNLTISGTSDDRAMERKVKQWIRESMNEAFSSMARKAPRLQEV